MCLFVLCQVEVSNLKSERERIKLTASGSEERIAGLEAELEAAKQVRHHAERRSAMYTAAACNAHTVERYMLQFIKLLVHVVDTLKFFNLLYRVYRSGGEHCPEGH
jgi:hypothetical protein